MAVVKAAVPVPVEDMLNGNVSDVAVSTMISSSSIQQGCFLLKKMDPKCDLLVAL